MSAKYQSLPRLLGDASQVIGAGVTAQAISKPHVLTAHDAVHGFRCEMTAVSGTYATGISAKLQHSFDGGATWADFDATNAKVTIGANGQFSIPVSPWNSNYAAKFPMRPMVQVVITTGAGDGVTITDFRFTSAL